MTIIENALLHISTLLVFVSGFGLLILGYIKKIQVFYNWAFGFLLIGCLQSIFIAVIKGDLFVLSGEMNYEANFLFCTCIVLIFIVSIWSILIYYRHKLVTPILVQLGGGLSTLLIGVTISVSINQNLTKKPAKKTEPTRFLRTDDFEKGSSDSKLSNIPSEEDSLTQH